MFPSSKKNIRVIFAGATRCVYPLNFYLPWNNLHPIVVLHPIVLLRLPTDFFSCNNFTSPVFFVHRILTFCHSKKLVPFIRVIQLSISLIFVFEQFYTLISKIVTVFRPKTLCSISGCVSICPFRPRIFFLDQL